MSIQPHRTIVIRLTDLDPAIQSWLQTLHCPYHYLVGSLPPTAITIQRLLTASELRVFELMGAAISTKEIGQKLFISHKTVEAHRSNMCKKLGLRSKYLTKAAILCTV